MEKKMPRPLSKISAGETVRLVRINAGAGLNSRLTAMGLIPKVEIKVVKSGRPGPFVISVKGSKMMLGRGVVHKIMVI
ncbi:MAG: FeoA family protein [Planctomycetota bacterium]|jgi:Fe2+ transport system protein FeoA